MNSSDIATVQAFIQAVNADYQSWCTETYPWFRGEPESNTPLLPKLYRPKADKTKHDENQLLQFFRMKAPSLGGEFIPPRSDHTDQWLCLAQHCGLPTRLLDWSEGALVGLYFALLEEKPVVWMLHPVELNRLSLEKSDSMKDNEFPLTWVHPEGGINIGSENFRGAWELDSRGVELPVAIHPTNIHPRMSAQRSCFTIHGKNKSSINAVVPDQILKKYKIRPEARNIMLKELQILGISYSTIFPDLDGLSKDLGLRF